MIYEMQALDHFNILMLPVIAHFALLIGFSVWGFIDDSHNKYAEWVSEKIICHERAGGGWNLESTAHFVTSSVFSSLAYGAAVFAILHIHNLAPYVLAGFVAMMLIGRSLRRLQKIVTEHVNDKKIHRGGK